jgi:DNA replication protein DnaC
MKEKIREYCSKLRLGSIARNLDKIEKKDPEEYLLKLLEKELESREINRINRSIRSAGFPVIKTLEQYNRTHVKLPEQTEWNDLLECKFIEAKENLILIGPVGTGKTHLAFGLGLQACKKGKKVKAYTAPALVNMLLELYQQGNINKFYKIINHLDLLILDEVGYIPFHRDGSELLFQVISECYEKRSLIITTNLEFGHWNTIFGDTKLTSALIDRLIHHANFIIFNGESYRLRQSINRQI